ncbi:glycosyltransferase family 2 protein [Catellatospora vulcania]|uniref:glycosyltransferase family 2 protein n=1 Tax=Catellatospora vulcania TaxID=1460450 RepID=UPI0012D49C78|nr:glycosyltransferase family A protein [Catellatospora vulcania]
MSGGAPRLSVLIPTFGDAHTLALTLSTLSRQTLDPDLFEVVVVNDGSDPLPYSALVAAAYPFRFRFDSLPANLGRAAARNQAVRLAAGELVCFLDSDVLTEPHLLARHLAFHDGRDGPAVLIGKRYEGDWAVLAAAEAGEPLTLDLVRPVHEDFRFRVPGRDGSPEEWLSGAPWVFALTNNVSMPRRTVLDAGMFDEAYGARWGFEDTDLAYRIHHVLGDAGFGYDGLAVGFHVPAVRDLTNLAGDYQTNLELFRHKHRSLAAELVDMPAPSDVTRKIRHYRRVLACCAELGLGRLPDVSALLGAELAGTVLCQAFGTDEVALGPGSVTYDHGRPVSEHNLHLLGVWSPSPDGTFDTVVSVDVWRFLEQRELSRFLRLGLAQAREVVLVYTDGPAAKAFTADVPALTSPDFFGSLLRRRYPQARTDHFGDVTLFRVTAS